MTERIRHWASQPKGNPANLRPHAPWKKGESGNLGGGPKGKRITTWMAEFGEMSSKKLEWVAKQKNLPINAQIALARVRRSLVEDGGERSTEIVLDRTEGKLNSPTGSESIIAQILALANTLAARGIVEPEPLDVTPETKAIDDKREGASE